MKKIFFIVVVFLGMVSCSSQFHLRRAVAKDPSLLKTQIVHQIVHDTIFWTDTIRTPGVDTTFVVKNITNKWKVAYNDQRNTIDVMMLQNGDLKFKLKEKPFEIFYNVTIPREVNISYEIPPIAEVVPKTSLKQIIIYAIIALILLIFLGIYIRRL